MWDGISRQAEQEKTIHLWIPSLRLSGRCLICINLLNKSTNHSFSTSIRRNFQKDHKNQAFSIRTVVVDREIKQSRSTINTTNANGNANTKTCWTKPNQKLGILEKRGLISSVNFERSVTVGVIKYPIGKKKKGKKREDIMRERLKRNQIRWDSCHRASPLYYKRGRHAKLTSLNPNPCFNSWIIHRCHSPPPHSSLSLSNHSPQTLIFYIVSQKIKELGIWNPNFLHSITEN